MKTILSILGTIVAIIIIIVLLGRCTGHPYIEWKHTGPNQVPIPEVTNVLPPILPPADIDGDGEKESAEERDLQMGDLGVEFQGGVKLLADAMKKQTPNKNIPKQGDSYVNNVVTFGKYFLGTPYEYGSNRNTTKTFDCSDFTRYAYLAALGMDIPKDSRSQGKYVDTYSRRTYTTLASAKKGDLLFFGSYLGTSKALYKNYARGKTTITHVGIVAEVNNGKITLLHTASQPQGVRLQVMNGTHLEYRLLYGGGIL